MWRLKEKYLMLLEMGQKVQKICIVDIKNVFECGKKDKIFYVWVWFSENWAILAEIKQRGINEPPSDLRSNWLKPLEPAFDFQYLHQDAVPVDI